VELDVVHVRQVPGIDPQRVRPIEGPQPGKVETVGADVQVPRWIDVSSVQRSVGDTAQVPVPDGRVFRTREPP
jgi:hypothetical protein